MDPNAFDDLKAQVNRLEDELHGLRRKLLGMEAAWLERQGFAQEPPPTPTRSPQIGTAVPPSAPKPPSLPIPPIPPPPSRGRTESPREPIVASGLRAGPPPVPRSIPHEPGPIATFFSNAWRSYGPPSDLSWEMALGTWWLPRIGVGMVCIAIVWALTFAMGYLPEAWWPYLRLGVATVGCIGLLGIGKWLEKTYPDYARVLMGGGIALSYLVIFATHYIEYTQITDSPVPTLMLLAALTAVWFGAAALRRSWLLAMFVTAAGHATVALSTVTLDIPHPTAIMGLLALAAGTAAFLPREGWRTVAFAGLLGSYGNYFLWLLNSPESDAISAFVMAMGVLMAFYALYLLADLYQPEKQRTRLRPRWFYASINTAAAVVLGYALVYGFPFEDPIILLEVGEPIVTIATMSVYFFVAAMVLFGIAAIYAFARNGDRIYDLFVAKGSLLVAFGLIELFDGRTLTVALALEAIVLLILSMRQGLASTRLLALVAATAAFVYGVAVPPASWDAELGMQFGAILAVALSGLAFITMAALYEHLDWQRHARPPVDATLWWQPIAVGLEWVKDDDGAVPQARRTLAAALAAAGAILLSLHAQAMAPPGWQALLLALTGIVLVALAAGSGTSAWAIGAMVLAGTGAGHAAYAIGQNGPIEGAVLGIGALLVLAIASERQHLGHLPALSAWHTPSVAPIAYGVVASLAAIATLRYGTAEYPFPVWLTGGAVIAAALTLALHRHAWSIIATAYLTIAALGWLMFWLGQGMNYAQSTDWWWPTGIAIIVVGFVADRFFALRKHERSAQIAGETGLIVGALTLYQALGVWLGYEWQTMPHAALALGLLVWAGAYRSKTAAVLSGLIAVLATGALVSWSSTNQLDTAPMLVGFAGVIAFWVAADRGLALMAAAGNEESPRIPALEVIVPLLASALLTGMLYWLPAIPNNYTSIAWTLAAFSLFGVAFALQQKYYRYAGLALIFLVLARVFLVDTAQLEPAYRIAAGGLLGIVMCAIGYGYVRARQGGE